MNITSVQKVETQKNGETVRDKVYIATIDGQETWVPIQPGNRHYEAILEWIADGNTIQDAD